MPKVVSVDLTARRWYLLPRMGDVYVTRQVEFSAAHRLCRDELSQAENEEVFGKCANPYGHGHNYLLEVTVKGRPHPQNQMVIHFSQLKKLLYEVVVAPLDHHHLNYDVSFLEGVLPTSENLVKVLWDRIQKAIKGQPFELHKLRLSSTLRVWVEYYGENT